MQSKLVASTFDKKECSLLLFNVLTRLSCTLFFYNDKNQQAVVVSINLSSLSGENNQGKDLE